MQVPLARFHALIGCGVLLFAVTATLAANTPSAARQLHERIIVLDTHLDTPALFARPGWDIMDRHAFDTDRSQVDFPRMEEGGLDGGFWAIFTPQGPRTPAGNASARTRALLSAARIREMVAHNPDSFELAFMASDAERIAAKGRKIVYQSIENGYPLGQDVGLLETFYAFGVRMIGPVHFTNNDLGDSATDPSGPEWHGLSPLGRTLVQEANRLGMLLDGSHASDAVLEQMIELSKTPVILSHSGCKAIHDHPRNIDDALLRKLAASGGVIQINSLSEYLIDTPRNPEREEALRQLRARFGTVMDEKQAVELATGRREIDVRYPVPTATFDDFMKHLLHALEIAGPEHVGIGADWDGGGGVTGMWEVSSIPKITERLLMAGYLEADLQNIWGGNVIRLLQTAEDYVEKQKRGPGTGRFAR